MEIFLEKRSGAKEKTIDLGIGSGSSRIIDARISPPNNEVTKPLDPKPE